MNTAVAIPNRPYSIEQITGVMLPDGIFDGALPLQSINIHLTNTSNAPLINLAVYLEGVADVGIAITPRTIKVPRLGPSENFLCSWIGDFSKSSPGKTAVSFIASAQGSSQTRLIKHIFVSRTTYDWTTSSYNCAVPEGALRLQIQETSGPSAVYSPGPDRRKIPQAGPWIIRKGTIEISNPFVGQFGPLAFNDPWWKVVAAIVAVVAAIAAYILAQQGKGKASIGIHCDYDEKTGTTSNCRSPDPEPTDGNPDLTPAAICSKIAGAAMTVAFSDEIDPIRRGQAATQVAADEKTLSERLDFSIAPQDDLIAGQPFRVQCDWLYTRVTDRGSYHLSASDLQTNEHLAGAKQLDAPARAASNDQAVPLAAQIRKADGTLYSGPQLHVTVLVKPPAGQGGSFRVVLSDQENVGRYTGTFNLASATAALRELHEQFVGDWRLYLLAEDINQATDSMTPLESAPLIGGFFIASPESVSLAKVACPTSAPDATITVT